MAERDATAGSMGRLVAAGVVAMIGLGLGLAIGASARDTNLSLPGWALVVLGGVLALVLVVAGGLLYRSEFTPAHALRIAGWAILGTVLLALVIGLIGLAGAPMPLYAAATLLSVSTFAHVLIGVRDVQRIRATDLARQREKFEVLNRLVRHNLRHESQRLLFASERLEREDVPGDGAAEDVEAIARELTSIDDTLARAHELIRETPRPTTIDLRELLVDITERYREEYPDASIELVLPEDCHVESGEQLRVAIAELLENALEHGGKAPNVIVDATNRPEGVLLAISDDGPGIPEAERAVIEREVDINQLEHSEGLGLWYVRWVLDAYGGDLEFEVDDDGTTVRLALPAA